MLDGICKRHGIKRNELVMVGDRLYTDMAMAQRAGALSVLVLTGEATMDEATQMPEVPDLILSDLGAFGKLLQKTL
jgi:ribonucleotide monophosphatase NagD (HAD superfamily)